MNSSNSCEKEKMTGLRFQAKGWLLTYPQCGLSKETVLDALRSHGEIVEYVVCIEKHTDGSPHLHAFVKYSKKISYYPKTNSSKFDIEGFHGNYQVAKSWKRCERYCKKDGDYISSFDTESAKQKKAKHNKLVLTMDPIVAVEDGEIRWQELNLLVKTQQTMKMLGMKRAPSEELDLPKLRHYWIYGESNTGKTYKREGLEQEWGLRGFQIPLNNDWIGYSNEKYLWVDEFKGQLTIQQLNTLCDGGVKLNVKGGSLKLHRRPTVYVFSNYSIDDCFKNTDDITRYALKNRFIEEKLTKRYL